MAKFKVGDKVRVTKCLHGHGFNINEVVEIIHHNISYNGYECENNTDSGFLRDTEFELYKEKETEMALTNEMTAEQLREEIIRIDVRIEEAKKDIENAQTERNSLVEKLREKGFTLVGEISQVDSDKPFLEIGAAYVVNSSDDANTYFMVGTKVTLINTDECSSLNVLVERDDGVRDWMNSAGLTKI